MRKIRILIMALCLLPLASPALAQVSLADVFWSLNNNYVRFDEYPYAHGGPYITHLNPLDTKEVLSDEGVLGEDGTYSGKTWRVTAGDDVVFFPSSSLLMNGTEVEAMWKFLSLTAGNRLFFGGGANGFGSGNVMLGMRVALFQFNPLSAFASLGWSRWYGGASSNALCFGLALRSYPAAPLVLEWQPAWQVVGTGTDDEGNTVAGWAFTSRLSLGVMLGRLEVMAAWYYHSSPAYPSCGHGFSVGARGYL